MSLHEQGELFPRMTPEQQEVAESQIISEMTPVRYDTREYPVEVMVDKFLKDEFIIPKYQRAFVWNEEKKSKFIESVLLDLPIPLLFLADEPKTGKLEIVDGSQRIRTLTAFINNELTLVKLERLYLLNNVRFKDLLPSRQRRFKRKTIRSIELTENASWKVRKDLFERINTKPYDLTPMEIRKGIFEGIFFDFLKECSEDTLFKRLCPISDKRAKREEGPEMVLRFFAYANNYQNFDHRVDEFLDNYMESKHDNFDRDAMKNDFDKMLVFVDSYFPHGFRKGANHISTPRVRFEAISAGVHLALKQQANFVPLNVNTWLDSNDFKVHTRSDAANSRPKVIRRIEYVRDKLLGND